MPFTFSHPAIILPLTKLPEKRISATALVAGSMAPDFEYFIQMEMRQVHGHTIAGIFYFDLPLTIVMCFAFHYLMRDALIRYAPFALQNRFEHYQNYFWKERFLNYWYVIVYSALIGISSHLFWDSFTHANRFFVELIPFLQEKSEILGVLMYHHEVAQLSSSIIGLFCILLVVLNPFHQPFNVKLIIPKVLYWSFVLIILGMILILRSGNSFGDYIATTISGSLIGMMIAPILLKWMKIGQGKVFNKKKN